MLRIGLLLLLIGLWTVALFWRGLEGPFLLDDLQNIDIKTTNFQIADLISDSLQNESGPIGRPLSVFTLLLNGFLFGPDPFYYKAVNLAIHLLCGLFVGVFIYLLIAQLTNRRQFAAPTALLTSLLWLIHPIQVSTVLYAVQRMTQLSALFMLMGFCAYIYGRQSRTKYIYFSLLFCFPLAVLSKETGLLFPFYLFIIEYFILDFQCATTEKRSYLVHTYRIICLLMILVGLFYFYHHLSQFFSTYDEKNLSLIARLMTESKVLVFYLALIMTPNLSKMGLYHDDFIVSYTPDLQVFLSTSLLIAMIICIFYYRRRAPILAFGLSWFFISQLIESTLIPLELVFEHRNYLALVGILLIPCYYLVVFQSSAKKILQVLITLLFALLILLLSFLTFIRCLSWSSMNDFLKSTYIDHPHSTRLHIDMANAFAEQKNYAIAIEELNKAAKLQPNNIGILLNKILIGCQSHDIPGSLYTEVEAKIKWTPLSPYPMLALDTIVDKKFRGQCPSVDLDHLEKIIKNGLDNPHLRYKPLYRAMLYHLDAAIALMRNNIALCRTLLMQSYQAYPNRLDPLIKKAVIEWHYKLYDEAYETRAFIEQHDHFFNVPRQKLRELDKLLESRKTP